jgi:hypothetical protein
MKRRWSVALCVAAVAFTACATLPQTQARAPDPWVPSHELPEPGEGPPLSRN